MLDVTLPGPPRSSGGPDVEASLFSFTVDEALIVLLVLAYGSRRPERQSGLDARPDLLKVKRVGPVVPLPRRIARRVRRVAKQFMDGRKRANGCRTSTSQPRTDRIRSSSRRATSRQRTRAGRRTARWIAFLSARGGEKGEEANLYRIRVAGGEAERLSHGSTSRRSSGRQMARRLRS